MKKVIWAVLRRAYLPDPAVANLYSTPSLLPLLLSF